MASPGPRSELAAQEDAARAAALDGRLAARERTLTDRIRSLEARLLAGDGAADAQTPRAARAAKDEATLREALLVLRRELHVLAQARAAVATLPGCQATDLAALRDGFAPAPSRRGGRADGSGGARHGESRGGR